MVRWSELYRVAIGMGGLCMFAVSGACVTSAIEEGDFVLTGGDPEALLTVRTLVRSADEKWRELGIAAQGVSRTVSVELRVDGDGAAFEWNEDLSEEAVLEKIARIWLGSRLGGQVSSEKISRHVWVLDWMVGSVMSERSPTERLLWIARAGSEPMRIHDVLTHATDSTLILRSQRWLLGEWWAESGGAFELGGPVDGLSEADWVSFFYAQKGSDEGPFLNLEESAVRIESLGQLTVVQEGQESRVWLFELPPFSFTDVVNDRLGQLRLLRARVHPVYDRALLALIGAVENVEGDSTFARAFPQAWLDAEVTKVEIQVSLQARPR